MYNSRILPGFSFDEQLAAAKLEDLKIQNATIFLIGDRSHGLYDRF